MIKFHIADKTLHAVTVKVVTKRSNRVLSGVDFLLGTDARLVVEVTDLTSKAKGKRNDLVSLEKAKEVIAEHTAKLLTS